MKCLRLIAVTTLQLVLAAALCVVPVTAPSAASPVQVERAKNSKLFMWRVQSKATTVHLLGTIHVAKPELYPLDDAIESAFAQSTVLVVEADISAVDEQELQQLMLSRGFYPEGETLETHLAPTHVKRLQRYIEGREVTYDRIKSMRPWLASVVLGALELERLGYQTKHGIDMHFLTQAQASKKPILELESTSFQIDLFAGFSAELQELLLVYQIEQADEIGAQAEAITQAWRSGHTAAIDSLFRSYTDDDAGFEPLMKSMLDDRNVAMAEKIRGYLEDDSRTYFVVVGAGHLVGEQGLVTLLNDPALRIEQVGATAAEPAAID